jgi:uncharacterized protein (DUF1778 family)
MKSLHVKLSDEEEAILQEKAALAGCTVSDLVRGNLFRDAEQIAVLRPATGAQISELEKRINTLAEALQRLTDWSENCSALTEKSLAFSELLGSRMENAEAEIHSLSENIVRLVELQEEERRTPFGMHRAFFQVATMAGFTLASGTFSNDPEAWRPYKEDARRRAFKKEGDQP